MSLSVKYQFGLVKGQQFTPLQTSLQPKVTGQHLSFMNKQILIKHGLN